ncbi:sodium- and chloride-dependent betaine transporter-like isoform X2 [Epinephelus lanceolatus]
MTEETARGDPAGGSGPDTGATEKGDEPRGKWANKWEFILAMTGQMINLRTTWRFPFVCYRNGGGVGIASQVILAYLNICHIVTMAWALVYLYYSFKSTLHWSTCDNQWNSAACHRGPHFWSSYNLTSLDDYTDDYSAEFENERRTSEQEFWL